jgi:diguanylate cyclase (GGDEF)-like protein/PAS domain S-box-containing protein
MSYAVAFSTVAAAVFLRRLLDPLLGNDSAIFQMILLAVLFTGWYGGLRPALAAVILGIVLADYFLVEPRESFFAKGTHQYVQLALFFITETCIGIMAGYMHRVRLGDRQKVTEAQKTLSQTEERLRLTLRSSGIAVWSFEIAPNVVAADDHSCELFGLPTGQFPKTVEGFLALLVPEDRERVQQEIANAIGHGTEYSTEFRVLRPDGELRYLAARAKTYYTQDGKPHHQLGVCWDVTERRRAETALRESDDKLKEELQKAKARAEHSGKLNELVEILQSCQNSEEACHIVEKILPTILPCRAGALCLINPSRNDVEAVASWGGDPGTQTNFRPDACWALRRGKIHDVRDAASPVRCTHVTGAIPNGYLCFPLAAQGETLGVMFLEALALGDAAATGTRLEEDFVQRAVEIGERISPALANLRLREMLHNQSIRDPLTGLFNRRYLQEILERDIGLAERKQQNIAVVMFDLDHFKRFNDTFGHDAGDLVLREVANVLKANVRAGDIACRFGGEELVLVLPEMAGQAALERTDFIRREIKALSLRHKGQALGGITMSAGIAVYPQSGMLAEQLIATADKALYKAKEQGRDRVVMDAVAPEIEMRRAS